MEGEGPRILKNPLTETLSKNTLVKTFDLLSKTQFFTLFSVMHREKGFFLQKTFSQQMDEFKDTWRLN